MLFVDMKYTHVIARAYSRLLARACCMLLKAAPSILTFIQIYTKALLYKQTKHRIDLTMQSSVFTTT